MSFRFLGTAATVALISGPVLAQSSVTLYGNIDLDVEMRQRPTDKTYRMNSNASRWGIKGTENLGGGLSAVFGLEQGFEADTGAMSPQYRNAYVGLKGGLGALAIGRLDSATVTGSPLYSQVTKNIDFVIHDAGATAIGTSVLNARNRVSNAISYLSPEFFSHFTARARINLAGPEDASGAIGAVRNEDDFRQHDAGLNYSNGALNAGLGYAYDAKTGGLRVRDFHSKWQFATSYNFTAIKTYGLIGRDRYIATAASREHVNYWLVGFSIPVDNGKLTTNYMQRDVQTDRNGKLKKIQIGYAYKLSKRTTPYIFYDHENLNARLNGNGVATFGIGAKHSF